MGGEPDTPELGTIILPYVAATARFFGFDGGRDAFSQRWWTPDNLLQAALSRQAGPGVVAQVRQYNACHISTDGFSLVLDSDGYRGDAEGQNFYLSEDGSVHGVNGDVAARASAIARYVQANPEGWPSGVHEALSNQTHHQVFVHSASHPQVQLLGTENGPDLDAIINVLPERYTGIVNGENFRVNPAGYGISLAMGGKVYTTANDHVTYTPRALSPMSTAERLALLGRRSTW